MRWLKFPRSENRDLIDPRFRCCGCCHVRTGTVCLGIYNMIIQMVAMFVVLFAITHPEILLDSINNKNNADSIENGIKSDSSAIFGSKIFNDDDGRRNSEIARRQENQSLPSIRSERTDDRYAGTSSLTDSQRATTGVLSKVDVMIFTRKRVQSGDAHLALALLVGLVFITAMMVCGALKNRPLYLLPFFCFQVFDFVLACLTAAGHYTWLPNLQDMIQENPDIPFHDQLMKLDGQWVALCILMAYVVVLIAKAYFIGVVWACYQYLHMRRNSVLTYTTTEDGRRRCDAELLLPPNYEDALKMPPAYQAAAAPPPYAGNNNN